MPVSPDLGISIVKLVKEVAEVGSLKLSVDARPTIDDFLRGESNVNAGGDHSWSFCGRNVKYGL